MIHSAKEFVSLRTSERQSEYHRAAHDTATLETWYDTINSYPNMKIWVIHNKTVPLEVLRKLSDDPDADVRHAVAMKRKLDDSLFQKLSQDQDESVRQRIACNEKTPKEILKQLAGDPVEWVSAAAKSRLNRLNTDLESVDKG